MTKWISGFLEALAEMLTGSSQKPIHSEQPISLPEVTAVTPAVSQPSFASPTFEGVPVRVPSIDPLLAANYWHEALTFVDFSAFSGKGARSIQPVDCFRLDVVEEMAAVSGADSEEEGFGQGADVHVVLALWETNRRGEWNAKGRRHLLMAVPATRIREKFLAPRTDSAPVINERYLAPDLGNGCFSIGDSEEANERLKYALAALVEDRTSLPGWPTWWTTCVGVLQDLLGLDTAQKMVGVLSQKAAEVQPAEWAKPLDWDLFAVIYPVGGGGTKAVAEVYRSLVENMPAFPKETALFGRLCGGASAHPISEMPEDIDENLVGHIDENDAGLRQLFPLDPTQRNAVRAILNLKPGELQAVNGPPGSGKTSMLRAVVASKWVGAALWGEACPIIVACGATNQSVTNVIEAFGNAPHPDATMIYAQRWISDAASYGAYLPSRKVLEAPESQAELARFVCLKKSGPSKGFLYEYVNRKNVLDPSKAVDYEHGYIAKARTALKDPSIENVEDVLHLILRMLVSIVYSRREYLDFSLWTEKRRNCYFNLDASDFEAAHDLTWRPEAFHWAARYWEGRFLLAQRERLFSRHPLNVEEALRRLCMLTPCLVSTLHTAPQWTQIDDHMKPEEDPRSHIFGLIDLLVVDEGGQALPELAGAAFALAKRAAVVGDLKQLAPIWNHSQLAEIAIAERVGAVHNAKEAIIRSRRSVASGSALGMSRLVSKWKDPDDDGVTLQFHYRCKPSIIDYCNHLSYGGALQPKTDENEDFPEPALAWVAVDAEPESTGGSYRNKKEAEEIVSWIVERWPVWREEEKTKGKSLHAIVAIITPYRPQADYLERRLREVFDKVRTLKPEEWPTEEDIKKVTVGTVHRLQGAERPVVCFSLVEGPEQAGGSFIERDPTLLNVAVSRAKRSFIIFANPKRLFPPTQRSEVDSNLLPCHRLGAHLQKRKEARLLYPTKVVLIEAGGKIAALSSMLGKDACVIPTGGALLKLDLGTGVNVGAGFVPVHSQESNAKKALDEAGATIPSVEEVVFAGFRAWASTIPNWNTYS